MYFGETGEIPVRARRREMRRLRHTAKQTIGSLTLLPQGRGQGHWETEKADLCSAESKYPASKNASVTVASADEG